MRRMTAALAALLLVATVSVQAADPAQLFGSRVIASDQYPAVIVGDFDGDGAPDQAVLVQVKPASATGQIAPDVVMNEKVFGRCKLGAQGEPLALAVVQHNGRKTLFTGCQGEGASDFFTALTQTVDTGGAPITVARRGSKAFKEFQRQQHAIRYDILVVPTAAGIDTALYWNGKDYVLFAPNEEP